MKKELIIKKCVKCGAVIRAINDCDCKNCGIVCCEEKMQTLKPNSIDAAVEKHVPTYEWEKNTLKVKVKVNHVMEEEHFIEWICLVTENKEEYKYLKVGEEATASFENVTTGTLYTYCNKHGLWEQKIEK